jgi:hypothetical protein
MAGSIASRPFLKGHFELNPKLLKLLSVSEQGFTRNQEDGDRPEIPFASLT